MSETSQGPGWWLASDGRWYPPELWAGPPALGHPPVGPPPAATPSAPQNGALSGPPSPAHYPPDRCRHQGADPAKTNVLAVASLVCSILGFFILTAVIGVILGFVARSQIRNSRGTQRGDGLAVAGIIVGFCWLALFVVQIIVAAAHSNGGSDTVGPQALAGLAAELLHLT